MRVQNATPYAYGPEHLGCDTVLLQLSDIRGRELVVMRVIDEYQPLHVSIGGEPLVRYKELNEILP